VSDSCHQRYAYERLLYVVRVSGNLMSLGAIDFGLIVDGSVVIIENILRRLHQKKPEEQASEVILSAAQEVANVLRQKADQIAAVIGKLPGAADVRAERVAGLPYLRIHIRRDALARHGLDATDVLDTIEAIGGKPVGEIVEGNRRFTMQIRFPEQQRASADAIGNLRVGDSEGHFIPLAQLADIRDEAGPAQISRENGQRRISVEANVRGRDLASFVADAKKAVTAKVKIPILRRYR
jgi:cobalt-zinc-cadmium resistance protein CzcA